MKSSLLVIVTKNSAASKLAVQKAIEVAKEKHSTKLLLLYMYPLPMEKQHAIESASQTFQDQLTFQSEEAFSSCTPLFEGEELLIDKYVGAGNLLHEIRIQIQLGRCGLLVASKQQLEELMESPEELSEKLSCPVLLV